MRGKVEVHCHTIFDVGITPAYAGKRLEKKYKEIENEDHPRVCGEKGKLIPFYVDEVGSPPRMRGKVFRRIEPD